MTRSHDEDEKPSFAAVLDHYGVRYGTASRWTKTLCPIHDERQPSCAVNPDEGAFICYSCGAKGDVYSFVMAKENVDFVTAKRIIADITGVDQKRKSPGKRPGRRGGFRPKFGERKPE